MKYHFIYSLTYNDSVFYIGCTKDLVSRYSTHLASAKRPTTATSKMINRILSEGSLVDMRIINYLPHDQAIEAEEKLIQAFTSAGQQLTNVFLTTPWQYQPHNIPLVKTNKVMRKIIKYRQLAYYYQWAQRNKIADVDYPNNPF